MAAVFRTLLRAVFGPLVSGESAVFGALLALRGLGAGLAGAAGLDT